MGLKPGLEIWLCLRAMTWPNWSIILDNALSRGCYCFTNLYSKRYCEKPYKPKHQKEPQDDDERKRKNEWVRERGKEREVLAQRFALMERKVRQLLAERTELNFHSCAPSRGARALPWVAQQGGRSCTPDTNNAGCTLAKGSANWWDTTLRALYKLASCQNAHVAARSAGLSLVGRLRAGGNVFACTTAQATRSWVPSGVAESTVNPWHFSFFFKGPPSSLRLEWEFGREEVSARRAGSRVICTASLRLLAASLCLTAWCLQAVCLFREGRQVWCLLKKEGWNHRGITARGEHWCPCSCKRSPRPGSPPSGSTQHGSGHCAWHGPSQGAETAETLLIPPHGSDRPSFAV